MRLIGSHEAADEIFMNFASGGQQNENVEVRNEQTTTEEYEDPLDDVFGSAPPSPVLRSDHDETLTARRDIQDPSDIPRLRSVHVTNGYREGIAVSKEQHVQAGFDEGYSLGAELGMKVGWILGVLEGISRATPPAEGETAKRDGVRAEMVRAEEELSMKQLFGDEFFGNDGVWVYAVPGTEETSDDDDVTFGQIADAHPLVVKWTKRVKEMAQDVGFEMK